MHPVYNITPNFSELHSNNIFPSTPTSSAWSLTFRFSNQNFVCISITLSIHKKLDWRVGRGCIKCLKKLIKFTYVQLMCMSHVKVYLCKIKSETFIAQVALNQISAIAPPHWPMCMTLNWANSW
jgi:hypothetical protein